MKVRFYRGPLDGQRKEIRDGDYIVNHIEVEPRQWTRDINPTEPLPLIVHTYRATRHTHPDGSVFFEWTQPRGTKWRKTPKPKRRKKAVEMYIGVPLAHNLP